MMRHEEAVPLLLDLRAGVLSGRKRGEVEAHLSGCGECGEMRRTLDALHAAFRSDPRLGTHPSSEELVLHATRRPGLTREAERALEEHLTGCDDCTDDVRRVREVDGMSGAARMPSSRSWRKLALAAGLAGLGLLVAGDLAVRIVGGRNETMLQELSGQVDSLRGELGAMRAWSGAVAFNLLPAATRAASGALTLSRAPGQPFLLLAVELDPTQLAGREGSLRFSIETEDGAISWSSSLAAERTRNDVKESGVVTFLLAGDSLTDGAGYTFLVASDEEELSRASFTLVTRP